jgi:hypothetical protein
VVGSGSSALDARLALQDAGLCMAVVWGSSFQACSLSSGRGRIVLVVEARRETVGGLVGLRRRKGRAGVGLHSPCRCWLALLRFLWLAQWVRATLAEVLSRRLRVR